MDLGIKGKIAIVTGTGRKGAMGDTIARTLAAEGVNIACADIVVEGAEEIAKGIAADLGVKTIAVKVDQSSPESVKEAADKIRAGLGSPDILVNNAALLAPFGRIEKMEVKDYDRMVRVNMDGCYYWIREIWNDMAEKNWGRIINISSIAGIMGGFGQGRRHRHRQDSRSRRCQERHHCQCHQPRRGSHRTGCRDRPRNRETESQNRPARAWQTFPGCRYGRLHRLQPGGLRYRPGYPCYGRYRPVYLLIIFSRMPALLEDLLQERFRLIPMSSG